jgi:hypothetical protein
MIYIRVCTYVVVVLCGLFLPLWAFAIGVVCYALAFEPYELIVLAVCIDAQFGDATQSIWYLYTAITVSISTVVMFTRPYLRMYT